MEIAVLHHFPANLSQMEITYYTTPCSFTPDGDYPITQPLLIYSRWRLSYYTTPVNLPQMEITTPDRPPVYLSQMEIALLHHPMLIYPR